ncbi:hypothetical protein, partial [Escherichia coli]|uniref:hypothetical protein n=1 Tax=Escherichia coli TaxID=562 RepID=UPI00207917AF
MTEQEMPRYQCHKKVRALKIGSIEHKPNPDQPGKSGSSSYGAIIHPDDKKYAAFDVSAEYICKHRPMNRPGFPGECFICELRLPDHRFRWKH